MRGRENIEGVNQEREDILGKKRLGMAKWDLQKKKVFRNEVW